MDTPSSPWSRIALMIDRYPSPHNTQPVHLLVHDQREATVLFDTACALPAHPLGLLFSHVTIGIYVEQASIAAHALGLGLEVEVLTDLVRPAVGVDPSTPAGPDGDRLQPVARLRLDTPDGGPVDDLDPELMRVRRTSRLPYDGRDVPAAVLAELREECERSGHGWGSTGEPDVVVRVVDLNQQTLFDDLATPAVRDELRAWVRLSSRSARRSADGFSPECLHTPGLLLRTVFRHDRLWALPPLRALSRRVYLRSMRGTPRVAWVRGPLGTTEDAVRAGRLLIRLWLRLAGHGVAVHPFGSVVTNEGSLRAFEDVVGVPRPTPDAQVWMVLRLGHGTEPPRSLRHPVHQHLHQAQRVDEGVR